jgi:hypothetical protein
LSISPENFPGFQQTFGPFIIRGAEYVDHKNRRVSKGYQIELTWDVVVHGLTPEAWFIGHNKVFIRVPSFKTEGSLYVPTYSYYLLTFMSRTELDYRTLKPDQGVVDEDHGNLEKESHYETKSHRGDFTNEGWEEWNSQHCRTTWKIGVVSEDLPSPDRARFYNI